MKTISIGGKSYSWLELSKPEVRRAVLPEVERLIAEYKRAPARLQAQGWNDLDLRLAIVWGTGQLDGVSESQMGEFTNIAVSAYNERITELGGTPLATALTASTQPAAIDGKSAFKALADLMKDKEVVIALQKRRVGQPVDAKQVALLEHHDQLSAANNSQARAERAAKITRPPRAALSAPPVRPTFASIDEARAKRLEHQNNLSGPYYTATHPDYAQVRAEVKAAYQLETGEKTE